MGITTIILVIIITLVWISIIFQIYNAKEFEDLFGYKEGENDSYKTNDIDKDGK